MTSRGGSSGRGPGRAAPRRPMWLVRIALERPYTFVVMAMLIVILGAVTLARMPTDIFPDIDIPVISVVWNYSGLSPEDMEKRIVTNCERALTTTVNGIEHIESQSLTGIAVVKIFFQPNARIEAATAQVTAISQTVVRQMPPGATLEIASGLTRDERVARIASPELVEGRAVEVLP
jgi:multidrug efflux pump subunit AcrB